MSIGQTTKSKQVFIRWSRTLQLFKQNFTVEQSRRCMINQTSSCKNVLSLVFNRKIGQLRRRSTNIQNISILTFNTTILLWCMNARCFISNHSLSEKSCKTEELCAIITSYCFNRLGELSFNHSQEITILL